MKKTALMAIALCAALSASAKEANDTLVVTTNPQMHCEGCENRIKKNIRFVNGTKKIETSVPEQTVTIIFDKKKATPANYTEAFKKIGYEVKVVEK